MRVHRLDLNLLAALDALLTEQSVTRAAQRINLSQSAMSGVLARLREHFEDELLIQVGRKMVLTELGGDLIDPVRDVLGQIRELADKRAHFDPKTSHRHFKVVASDYVIHFLMVEIVRRIAETAPNVTVSFELLQSGSDAESRERFDRGDIDLIILPKPYALEGVANEVLFEEGYVCVVWSHGSLATQRLTLKKYLAHRHVVRVNANAQMPSYDEMHLRALGYKRKVAATGPSFILLPQLVIGTDFIATAHTRIARYYSRFLPIEILPSPIKFPNVVEVQQWPKLRDRDPGALWLRETVRSVAREIDRCDRSGDRSIPDEPVHIKSNY